MLDDRARQRDFPALARAAYLNTAAEGLPPSAVTDALLRYARDHARGSEGRPLHMAEWEAARAAMGRLLGFETDEVALCGNSAEAFNLAARALRLRDGDEVVVNDLDFPSGRTPWIHEPGVTVRHWRAREGGLCVEELRPLLSPRTRLVATSLVSFYNGFRVDLDELAAAARQAGEALLAVDVTQAVGRLELDLRPADLVVSSTHKWLVASHGCGVVAVPRRRWAEWTVPAGGWFNQLDAFSPDGMARPEIRPGPGSFMCGMPNFPAAYALRAAGEYLLATGVGAIAAGADPLVEECLRELSRRPVELLTPREPACRSGIVAFRHARNEEIAARMAAENVIVMHSAGRLRVSFHGYNRPDELARFLDALDRSL